MLAPAHKALCFGLNTRSVERFCEAAADKTTLQHRPEALNRLALGEPMAEFGGR
jgi:hypothetical protein